jgi:hypothetical protein
VPRYSTGKTRVSTEERAKRAAGYRVYGYKDWIDPFPTVHGTLPEKMVYAALSSRRIPFLFLNNVNIAIPELELFQTYQADFVIPSLNLIIEVQGAYFHSKPEAIESDAFKFALYQQAGYRVIGWWDYDIMARLPQLFMQESLLAGFSAGASGSTELTPVDRTKVDTSQGIRTLNKLRAARQAYKKPIARVKSRYGKR